MSSREASSIHESLEAIQEINSPLVQADVETLTRGLAEKLETLNADKAATEDELQKKTQELQSKEEELMALQSELQSHDAEAASELQRQKEEYERILKENETKLLKAANVLKQELSDTEQKTSEFERKVQQRENELKEEAKRMQKHIKMLEREFQRHPLFRYSNKYECQRGGDDENQTWICTAHAAPLPSESEITQQLDLGPRGVPPRRR